MMQKKTQCLLKPQTAFKKKLVLKEIFAFFSNNFTSMVIFSLILSIDTTSSSIVHNVKNLR